MFASYTSFCEHKHSIIPQVTSVYICFHLWIHPIKILFSTVVVLYLAVLILFLGGMTPWSTPRPTNLHRSQGGRWVLHSHRNVKNVVGHLVMLITFCLNKELLRGTGYCYIAVIVKRSVFSSFVRLKNKYYWLLYQEVDGADLEHMIKIHTYNN